VAKSILKGACWEPIPEESLGGGAAGQGELKVKKRFSDAKRGKNSVGGGKRSGWRVNSLGARGETSRGALSTLTYYGLRPHKKGVMLGKAPDRVEWGGSEKVSGYSIRQ